MPTIIDTFANRLSYAVKIRNIKPIEISKKTGISKTNISCYMSGKYEAKQEGVKLLAQALYVNPVWLMGYDVPMEDINIEGMDSETKESVTIFVYGTIPARNPC